MTYIERLGFLMIFYLTLTSVACASMDKTNRQIDQALDGCLRLDRPEVTKASDELWFWLQSERVESSRKLWSRRGISAIERRLLSVSDEQERVCLDRLLIEATTRQVVRY